MCSARLQNVTSSCTNLAKQSEQLSVLRACDIPKKGTVYFVCGKCLMPSPEQTERTQNRIGIISDPLCVIKCHGPEDWQYHHWKAKDATKNAKKSDYTTIAKRSKNYSVNFI